MRNIILIFIPAVMLLAWYIIDDPFMLYWHYDNLCEYGQRKQCRNDAYRGIRWMDQYDDSMHYNSFIIGSSRSSFYYVEDWKQYLGEDASCFHFSQNGDNLFGAWQRIQYLYHRFERIDNILLIMDAGFLCDMKPHKGHLYSQPWQVKGKENFLEFNREYIIAFFSLEYQKQVWGISNNEPGLHFYYIPEYNELHRDGAEIMLNTNPEQYYALIDEDHRLYPRTGEDNITDAVIFDAQKNALTDIRNLFQSHNTDYRIVISPLYDQWKINSLDLQFLNETFGEDKVFDFSGVNEYTNNVSNYYENSHYRPQLCRQILKIIYQ